VANNEEVITVNLNVNITKSEQQLKKTEARLKKIQDLAAGISKGTSLIDARSIKGGKDALKAFKKTLEDLAKSNKNYATTTAGLDRQLGKLRATFRGIRTDAKEFTDALVASEKIQRQLYKTQQETRAIRGRALTGGEAGGVVSALIAQKDDVYQSISALRAYRTELTRLKEAVRMNSNEFNQLEQEIKRVDGILNKPKRKRTQDIKRNIGGITGREKALQEALRIQNETESSALGYRDAVLGVQEAQEALNRELRQAVKLQAQITQSTVSWGRAQKDLMKAAGALGGGIAKGLSFAGPKAGGALKAIGGSRLGQIGSARIFSDLMEKIPAVDKVFGRFLQKIPLLGKLLNENISVNARWAAQILEGITGVTIAWNGLNQIISAAQAFTAFERQAAIAINSVARMFKEMYNVAGAMMMGLISPGQVGKNLWDKALDRPDVMRARRGRSRIESLENQLPKYKEEFKNTELYEYDRIELKARQILEIEEAITHEQRSRIYIMKRIQAEKGGPVWTQYGSPAGPGSKGAGWGSNAQDRLGDIQLRIGEQVTANTLDNQSAVRGLLLEERKVNAELARRKEILRVINQGVENVNLSVQEQRDLFGISNAEALESQKQQSPLYASDSAANAARFRAGKRGKLQRRRQRGQILQEGLMLGAGFPLLFGGGMGSVLGGTGGALWQGTRKKPERGFGGQIIASAAGQVLDRIVADTIRGITELGQALNPLTADISKLTTSLGLVGTEEGKRLAAIEELRGTQAALTEATKLLSQQVGAAAVESLKIFGQKMQDVGNEFNKAMTKMGAAIASVVEESGILELTEAMLKFINNIDISKLKLITSIFLKLATTGIGAGPLDKITGIATGIFKKAGGTSSPETGSDIGGNYLNKGSSKIADLNEEVALVKRSLEIGSKAAEQEQEALELLREQNLVNNTNLELADTDLLKGIQKRDQLKEQLEMWNQIKDTIAGGLTNAIMGLIDRTKTLAESLAGILKQIAQILIQKAIMSAIDKIPWGGAEGGVTTGSLGLGANDLGGYTNTTAAQGAYWTNGIKPFATGGLVTRPTIGLVGEAGEDEYIIPSSKMQGAMERYSAGARGQGVIPGGGTVASGSGVSSTPTVVNYTGPVLSFDSEAYVPKSAIPEIINSAARRGAQEGESKVFSKLKNSRSQRSRVGM